ncbi:MAG TPA: low temperature requirement protein A [Sphingomonadaceae bacterium]|nr:low temperature requirement protein A [Sphingomonadaceae bacterium]
MAPLPSSLLRVQGEGEVRVSYLELFFDLVYVFAITQISHFLLAHHGIAAVAEALVIFAAIWWAWVYTTWAANWLDPDKVQVRIVLLLAMLASLVMAVATPKAFGEHGMIFAGAYLALQVGRSGFVALVMRRSGHEVARTMQRIVIYFVVSGCLWIAGALTPHVEARLLWWAAALAVEYSGPGLGYRLPFIGGVPPSDWRISGGHMAERCALFIIIALGEGIVVTGATFAGHDFTLADTSAFLAAFTGSVLMWWIYFDVGAKLGAELIEHHPEPGRIARSAYTYLHMPIVVGIIVTAVGDEMLLAHPQGHAEPALILAVCGGSAIYLLGVGLFKRFANPFRNFPMSHRFGLGLLALLALWASLAHPATLTFGWLSIGVLALVTLWEWFSYHGGWVERLGHRMGPVGRYMQRSAQRAEARRTERMSGGGE